MLPPPSLLSLQVMELLLILSGSTLWTSLASVAPEDLMPQSVILLFTDLSFSLLSQTSKETSFPFSVQLSECTGPNCRSCPYPSSAFQFVTRSRCLWTEKDCNQVFSAHRTGNHCVPPPQAPHHSFLHTIHTLIPRLVSTTRL